MGFLFINFQADNYGTSSGDYKGNCVYNWTGGGERAWWTEYAGPPWSHITKNYKSRTFAKNVSQYNFFFPCGLLPFKRFWRIVLWFLELCFWCNAGKPTDLRQYNYACHLTPSQKSRCFWGHDGLRGSLSRALLNSDRCARLSYQLLCDNMMARSMGTDV